MSTGNYQLFEPLADEQYQALKADIAERGVMVPIVKDEHGNVLDGHHRLRACEELGITDYRIDVRSFGDDEDDKLKVVLRLNFARRQLGAAERGRLVSELRRRFGWSNRMIAGQLGVSEATVRRDLAGASSDAPDLEVVLGADGKTYQANRPRASAQADLTADEARALTDEIQRTGERTWELLLEAQAHGRLPLGSLRFSVHPALTLIPPMRRSERQGLEESIRRDGLLMPITLYQGQILDGRERLAACEKVGVEPTFREYEGDDPLAYVLSEHLHRQHLSPGQRRAITEALGPG
jgi:ParB/RepB/Spo0J family partition protein